MAHFHGSLGSVHLHGNGSQPAAAAPGAPASVSGASTGGTTATISWADGTGTETGFDVELETPAGSGAWVAAVGGANPTAGAARTFSATGLSPITAYTPRVRGFNVIGTGAWTYGVPFITDNTGSGGGEITPGALPLSNAEMRDLYTWVSELHLIHGLRAGSPLSVSATARTASTISQAIAESSGAVTVTRQ